MHRNPWVAEDIAYWETKAKPGGIICGDGHHPMFPDVVSEAQKCAERFNSKIELPGHKFWVVKMP